MEKERKTEGEKERQRERQREKDRITFTNKKTGPFVMKEFNDLEKKASCNQM